MAQTKWDGNGAIHRYLFDNAWGADVRNLQQRMADQLKRKVEADAKYGPRSIEAAKDLLWILGWPEKGDNRHPLSQTFQLYIRIPDKRPAEWKQRQKARAAPDPPPGAPGKLPLKFYDNWRSPWLDSSDTAEFREWCWDHGYVSPHYTKAEWASKGGDACGCPAANPPDSLRGNAQLCAFRLERVRHANGDRPIPSISFYRSPCHNSCVGGASASQHMQAGAADTSLAPGTAAYNEARRAFSGGGIGYQSHVGGTIRHLDVGPARSWVYA